MKIDPRHMDYRDAHHLLIGAIVPRPIAWVSTVGENGVFNLAPFSFYAGLSVKPAIVGFAVGSRRDGSPKDTLRNVLFRKDFVINVVNEALQDTMNTSATPFPPEVSEFEKAGLTPARADLVKAPLVAEAPVSMECQLRQILEFGEFPNQSSFIIGEVLLMHVKDGLLVNGAIDVAQLKAIGRLEGDNYCRTGDRFYMQMPRNSL
ncbi:MAG: flavin reductase family protein [Chloroflexi bacterium]|nr:flavin reductase family protein [Chloroflexota bacterium]